MCTDLLPANISPQLLPKAQIGCERIEALRPDVQKLSDISDALHTEAKYLETLATEWQTYFLTGDENEVQKRSAIAASAQLHRIKGTVAAIKAAYRALGIEATIVEWWESGKSPYLFDIELGMNDQEITPELYAQIVAYTNLFKNARSHIDEVILSYLAKGGITVCSGTVGEVCATAQMLERYTAVLPASVAISSGCVGEVSYTIRSQT